MAIQAGVAEQNGERMGNKLQVELHAFFIRERIEWCFILLKLRKL